MTAHSVVIVIRTGHADYIPYGCVATVLYSAGREDEEELPTASGIVLTVFSSELAAEAGGDVWKNIVTMNKKWRAKVGKSRWWQHRVGLFDRFVADVSATAPATST